eukprot:14142080-Ditylum_brightwellii.AAC.1
MMQKNGRTCNRCTRGLEHMVSPELMEQKKINKDCVYSGVFKEQQRQRMQGINDIEEIRNVSSIASQWARKKAFEQGIVDAITTQKMNGACFAPR